jgi:hypothetical protein
MTFTHDWQLDCIIAYGKTLQSLTLDDCPIVHDAMVTQTLDPERYVQLQDDRSFVWSFDRETTWSYNSRWHDNFRKMATGLPRLQRFGMGYGPWDRGTEKDRTTSAFEAAASLPARLEAGRYIIFHWSTGASQWIEPRGMRRGRDATTKVTELNEQYGSCWEEDDDPPPPSYPDCWDQDQEALDVFLSAMKGRKKE